MQFGIDVSRWQGNFNFAAAKTEGVGFAILKAGGSDSGRYRDGKFETYYAQCKQLNIPVGAYYFGRDFSIQEAQASANHFLSLLNGKQFEYPVYYDVEGDMIKKLDRVTLTAIVDTFCSIVEKAGYYTGIYSSQSFFNNNMNDTALMKYTHWVAAWVKNKPTLKSGASVDIWQMGGETNVIRSNKIAGVTCDQDYAYVNFPSVIKKVGLNGFPKAVPEEPKPVHHTVKDGDTLTAISKQYGVDVDTIVAKNQLIKTGQDLLIK